MTFEEGADRPLVRRGRPPLALLHGGSQTARVAGVATSATQPARKAGQISATLSSVQPGSALQATGEYFAGNEGATGGAGTAAGGAGASGAAGNGVVAGALAATSGLPAWRGAVAQPARISSAAAPMGGRVPWTNEGMGTRWYGSSSKRW